MFSYEIRVQSFEAQDSGFPVGHSAPPSAPPLPCFGGWGFGVLSLGFGVWGWGCRVWGVGCWAWGLGFGIWGRGCMVYPHRREKIFGSHHEFELRAEGLTLRV